MIREKQMLLYKHCVTEDCRENLKRFFVDASLPDVDTDDIQRKIAELQEDLTAFAHDIACIEQHYKDKAVENEQENC